MFRPTPHGAAGPYDELICFGILLLIGMLYLGLYFVAGRRLKSNKDQSGKN